MPRVVVASLIAIALFSSWTSPSPAQQTEATTLSVYNFNINKMEKNWPGWIAHIKESGRRLPDLIIVQDFESKSERLDFQKRLQEELGDTWYGRGTAEGWHAAIVWRAGRFENPKSRTWRGFGDPVMGTADFSASRGTAGLPRYRFAYETQWPTAS